MAQTHPTDPDLGTREEDWPDPDVDSDAESGADAIRRSEAAMHATIDRSLRRRRCPPHAARDAIPQSLYVKAELRQDELTEGERALLLSRGDVVGKALARPGELTAEEAHEVLGWPAPDAVREAIKRATDGAMSSPTELYAKGKDALDRGEPIESTMSAEEIGMLARGFRDADAGGFPAGPPMMAGLGGPGAGEGMALAASRMGLDLAVFRAAAANETAKIGRRLGLMAPGPAGSEAGSMAGPAPAGGQSADVIGAMHALAQEHELGNVTDEEVAARNAELVGALRATTPHSSLFNAAPGHPALPVPRPAPAFAQMGIFGSAPWPPRVQPRNPHDLFREDAHVSGFEAFQGWYSLSEEVRQAYRESSESLRLEAWALHEGFG
ncbi:hypothetical protein CPLU01_15921 [Colletotrichum plurivorum]|uniref:Uncharacterized protein n=1 Tax=Colletotrichum plurivorum TaxID=2175906 RepID=A0A8H6J560_9PEZI|nr:hypothetical protein CPLU01_15921 [Colletotrichum plurivorum]